MSLHSHPSLRPFLLKDVHPTGRNIGLGSYGSVEEVEIPGAVCAAKKIHDFFQDPTQMPPEGIEKSSQEFVRECQLMSELRHPHIVQFLGLCSLPGSRLPALVMEKLLTSLHEVLDPEHPPKSKTYLPMSLQCSILHGIASGISFLHAHTPPIIHRDLSAKNILLNEGMVAKIADLGMARIVPSLKAATMTKAPGASIYMPPEALDDKSRYDVTIDIFSIGILAIFILSQTFPEPLAAAYMNTRRVMVGRTELERRSNYMQTIYSQLRKDHPLIEMIEQCLSNLPEDRPRVGAVLTLIDQARAESKGDEYNLSKLGLIQALNQLVQARDQFIQEKMEEIQSLEQQIEHMSEQIESQLTQITQLQRQQVVSTLKHEETSLSGNVMPAMEHETEKKSEDEYYNVLPRLTHQASNSGNTASIEHTVVPTLKRQAGGSGGALYNTMQRQSSGGSASSAGNIVLKWPLPLQWRKGKDLPTNLCMASTVTTDDAVFCGGNSCDSRDVLQHISDSGIWSKLPQAPANNFFMTSLMGKLVLAGGRDTRGEYDDRISVWDTDKGKWVHPYPPMPTSRSQPAAVGYRQYLIVACGDREGNTVEILNTSTATWYTAEPVPLGGQVMSTALVNKLWYLSSYGQWKDGKEHIFCVNLPTLISDAISIYSTTHLLWRELPTPPIRHPTLLALQEHLLLVGGIKYRQVSHHEYTQALYRYDQDSAKWKSCGELPYGIWGMCAAVLSSNELMVAGGVTGDGKPTRRLLVGLIQTLLVHI